MSTDKVATLDILPNTMSLPTTEQVTQLIRKGHLMTNYNNGLSINNHKQDRLQMLAQIRVSRILMS